MFTEYDYYAMPTEQLLDILEDPYTGKDEDLYGAIISRTPMMEDYVAGADTDFLLECAIDYLRG